MGGGRGGSGVREDKGKDVEGRLNMRRIGFLDNTEILAVITFSLHTAG